MTISKTTPIPGNRKKQFDTVRIQLSSQRLSDNWRGMNQVRQWLEENPEDGDVYGLLLDAVEKDRDLREQVRNLLIEMMQKDSKKAEEAISLLPSSVDDLLADADDAYYAAEYDRAIQLYRQVLKLDPENTRAKSHLTEARSELPNMHEKSQELPRDAVQYFRRARSFIAAKDYLTAMKLLGAAVEAAQSRGMKYTEAENLLASVQDSSIAEEFKQKVYQLALEKGRWKDAFDLCTNSLLPDMTDESIKNEFSAIQHLLNEELALQRVGLLKIFSSLSRLQKSYRSAKEKLNPNDSLLKYIGQQLSGFQTIRIVSILLIVMIAFGFIYPWKFIPQNPEVTFSSTPTSTVAITATEMVTLVVTDTPTLLLASSETPAITETPAPSKTPTVAITPTSTPIGYGSTNLYYFPLDMPNGKRINHSLKPGQIVTIVEQKNDLGGLWYRCVWTEADGKTYEGWVLAQLIKIVPTPSS